VDQPDIGTLNAGDADILRSSSSTSKRRSREGS
jgi:hypothetical protein